MSDNFQDNVVYGNSTLAVSGDAIIIGSTDNGAKSVIFNNSGSQGHLAWQPTVNETIFLPNSGGTIQLTGQAPGAIYDGANSISSGTIRFTNANGVSFSINGQTISGSVAAQTNQSVGLYALGNTTQNSSTNLDARSLSFNALGVISAGFSNGSIQLSVPSATVAFSNANNIVFGTAGATTITASAFFNFSAGTTSNNLSSITFSNSNGVSFGLNGSTITGSVAVQTNQSVGIYAVSNSTQNSSGTLDARSLSFQGAGIASVGYTNGSVVISVPSGGGVGDGVNILAAGTQTANTTGTVLFSNSNGVTFGMSNNSIITASVAAGGGTLSLYALGNTTQNSSTALDARSISFNALGAATMGYSNGSIQVSVPNGVVSFSNANGVSFGSAGATTITASVAAQTNQSVGLYALGNTTQNSSTTLDARSLSFNGLGIITVGYSNGSIQISATQSNQTQSKIAAIYDGANSISTGTIRFTNANGVSFSINGQTISGSVAAQTVQTVGLYALGNTTQNSSTTLDARTLSFNGLGGVSVGYSNGSIQISGEGGGAAISAGANSSNTGTVIFSNSNNITFGMSNNGVVTASFNANNTASTFVLGISTQGNSAGTTGFANQSVQLVGSNGLTLSQSINGNSATITIVDYPPVSNFHAHPVGQISSSQQTNSQMSFRYVLVPSPVSMSRLDIPMIVSITSSATTNTGGIVFTSGAAIYTRNGSTLNPIVGNTGSTTYTWASNTSNYSNIIGLRVASFPLVTLLTPGEYWVGVFLSTTNNSSIGLSTTQLANTISMLCGSTYTALGYADFGQSTGGSSSGLFLMQGLCSLSISNTTMTFQQSQISVTGVQGVRANIDVIFRNY